MMIDFTDLIYSPIHSRIHSSVENVLLSDQFMFESSMKLGLNYLVMLDSIYLNPYKIELHDLKMTNMIDHTEQSIVQKGTQSSVT